MAINSANQVTRMGMGGAMWQPHGSYAGKEAGTPVPTPQVAPARAEDVGGGVWGWGNAKRNKKRRIEAEILQDDEDLLALVQMAMKDILKHY